MLPRVIVGLALLIGAEIVAAIVATLIYDPEALARGWDTISWDTLQLGLRHPFYAALISGVICFLLGALYAHLWLFQVVVIYRAR